MFVGRFVAFEEALRFMISDSMMFDRGIFDSIIRDEDKVFDSVIFDRGIVDNRIRSEDKINQQIEIRRP